MLNQPAKNKMMTNAPAKKEYHFAPTAEHYAAVVYAETMEEAEELYHKAKLLIRAPKVVVEAPALSEQPAKEIIIT